MRATTEAVRVEAGGYFGIADEHDFAAKRLRAECEQAEADRP